MASRLMLVEGEVQRSREGVTHLMATRVFDRTDALDLLSADETLSTAASPQAHHPRNVRVLPRSRDFH